MRTEDASDSLVGTIVGRYRLLRKLGEGGMGTVYLAERTEDFPQQVALKLLVDGLHQQDSFNRFRLEQQALASLQHPHIVQMVDAGVSSSGTPYLAMDFVDGEALDVHCNRLRLSLAERIRLFLEVLDAVDYAHRRFLIHCDLKFSNILVSRNGKAMLLDFGVTKLLQPELFHLEAGITQATLRPFTPEFASPEQLQSAPLGTSTDIYSAGVVLYQLLCGVHPFASQQEDAIKLLRAICSSDPLPMHAQLERLRKEDASALHRIAAQRALSRSALTAALTGDLSAITAKALRNQPADRYPSALQFAADLRRYLDGQPVSAQEPSFLYRSRKLLQRHRSAAIAALAVSITASAAGASWMLQLWRAEQSRASATARFADVRRLTNTLLFDFYDSVAMLPGATPAQESLVRWSLSYLDDLQQRDTSDPTLRLELAESYLKLGNLLGNPYENNLGKPESAIATLTRGLAVLEPRTPALRAPTDSKDTRFLKARILGARGQVRWMSNQTELCLQDANAALDLFESLADEYPADARLQMEAASAHDNQADLLAGAYQLEFDPKAARRHLEAAMDYAKRAIAADPTPVRPHRGLGIFQMKIADAIAYDDPEAAIEAYKEAGRLFDAIPASGQQELATQRARRSLVFRSAWSYSALGRYTEAISMYRSIIAENEDAIRMDPTNERVHWDYAVLMRQLAEVHYYARDWQSALDAFASATDALHRFFEGGLRGERRAAYAEGLIFRGAMLYRLGRAQEAEAFTSKGIAILKQEIAVPDTGESLLQRAAEAFLIAQPPRLNEAALALDLLDNRLGAAKSEDTFRHLLRAEALVALGRRAEAVAEAKAAMAELRPKDNVNNWNRLQTIVSQTALNR